MGDSSDQNLAEEAGQEAVSLAADVAKTAAYEMVNLAAGVGSALVGKKPKTKEESELERLKREKEAQDAKMLRKKRLELRRLQAAQQSQEKMLTAKKEQEALPQPKPVEQLKRLRSPLPAVAKTRTELKGGWGAG